jgi:ribosomal protein RSM22 (predicted rRNA methylase)
MELPPVLRDALERALHNVRPSDLARASQVLTERYRAERRDGTLHLSSPDAVLAYLAARLPATYAAVSASLAQVAALRPAFRPETLLDVGAGPGTVLWAATTQWPELASAQLVEVSAEARSWGEQLTASLPQNVSWHAADVRQGLPELGQHDLVCLAYVLDELEPGARTHLLTQLWNLTADTLVLVEPGTPAGWQRIISARAQLLAAGAHPVAPCPHAAACPLVAPDWCHFSQRVARSRLHRQTKAAEVAWEDEKYSYLALSRKPVEHTAARVLATPRSRRGLVTLKLCEPVGQALERTVSKREGVVFKRARDMRWGDLFEEV